MLSHLGLYLFLDFRDFYIFKKYFRKNAEQTEKASAPQWKEDSTYAYLVLQLGRVCLLGCLGEEWVMNEKEAESLVGRTLESEGDYHIVEGEEYIIYKLE